jgi:hypothetical protein
VVARHTVPQEVVPHGLDRLVRERRVASLDFLQARDVRLASSSHSSSRGMRPFTPLTL